MNHFNRIKKRILKVGGLFLLCMAMLFVYISFLVPGKFMVSDWLRTSITEQIIESIERIEDTKFANLVVGFSEQNSNTLSFDEVKPYLETIQPGSVFVISHGTIVRNFIPGNWTHAGFYIGTKKQLNNSFGIESNIYKLFQNYYKTGEEHLVVDSSYRKGCVVRDIKAIAKMENQSTLHSIVCIEPKLDLTELSLLLQDILAKTGKDYDLNFSVADTSEIYCAELIYDAFKQAGIIINKRTSVLFRNILLPADIVTALTEKKMNEYFDYKMYLIKKNNKVKDISVNKIPSLFAAL